MTDDPYKNLAARYDLMRSTDPARQDFFRVLFRRHEVSSVLDCACGTGMDLLMFQSLGCDVAGSDLSESMLEQTRIRLNEYMLDIPLKMADFRELDKEFDHQFDAVVCLSNSINEVLDEEQAIHALTSMRSVLRDGGILVIDQGQTDASMVNPPKFASIVNDRDFSRVFVMEYIGNEMEVNILDLVHTATESDMIVSSVRICIRLQDDWERMFDSAGFSNAEYFGGWNFEPYSREDSSRLIMVCKK